MIKKTVNSKISGFLMEFGTQKVESKGTIEILVSLCHLTLELNLKLLLTNDMFNTFNRETEIDLTWFFDNWLFDWGYIDLEIVSAEDQEIRIRNNGGKAVSFKITTTTEDGQTKTEVISPAVWKNSAIYVHRPSPKNDLSEVSLEIPLYGDAVLRNNQWKKTSKLSD